MLQYNARGILYLRSMTLQPIVTINSFCHVLMIFSTFNKDKANRSLRGAKLQITNYK